VQVGYVDDGVLFWYDFVLVDDLDEKLVKVESVLFDDKLFEVLHLKHSGALEVALVVVLL
jgi:hypothetical protein